jgi:hypothetical protein
MILGQHWKTVIQKTTMNVVGNALFACPNREIPSFFLIDTCAFVNYAPTVCGINPKTICRAPFRALLQIRALRKVQGPPKEVVGLAQSLVWLEWQPVQPRRALTQQSQQYINHRSLSLMSFSPGTPYLVLLSNCHRSS